MDNAEIYGIQKEQLEQIGQIVENGFEKLGKATDKSTEKLEKYIETFVEDTDKIIGKLSEFSEKACFAKIDASVIEHLKNEEKALQEIVATVSEISNELRKCIGKIVSTAEIDEILGDEVSKNNE